MDTQQKVGLVLWGVAVVIGIIAEIRAYRKDPTNW